MLNLTSYQTTLSEQLLLVRLAIKANMQNFHLFSSLVILELIWLLFVFEVNQNVSLKIGLSWQDAYDTSIFLAANSIIHVIFYSLACIFASLITVGGKEFHFISIRTLVTALSDKFWLIFWPNMLIFTISSLGLFILIIFGLFYFYRTLLVPFILIFEGLPLQNAIKRSTKLTMGSKFEIAAIHIGLFAVFALISLFYEGDTLNFIKSVCFDGHRDISNGEMLNFLCFTISLLMAPIMITSSALFYQKCLVVEKNHKENLNKHQE